MIRDRVYDEAGNVIETHEHAGEFKESGDVPTLLHYVAGLLKAAVPPLVPLEANWGRRAGFASLNI